MVCYLNLIICPHFSARQADTADLSRGDSYGLAASSEVRAINMEWVETIRFLFIYILLESRAEIVAARTEQDRGRVLLFYIVFSLFIVPILHKALVRSVEVRLLYDLFYCKRLFILPICRSENTISGILRFVRNRAIAAPVD